LLKVLSDFVAVPKEVYIKYSLNILLQMEIIENDVLTNLGKLVIGMPCNNLFLSVAIVYGKIYKCSRELLQIATLIEVCKANVNELFNIPNTRDFSKEGRDKTNKFEKVKNKLANKYGDFLTLLYILEKYDLSKDKVKFCKDNFLKQTILEKAFGSYNNSKHQLQNISDTTLNELGVKMYPDVLNMELEDKILFCLMIGMRLNVGVNKKGTDFYRIGLSNMDNIKINKSSFLSGGKMWPNIMYHELFISMGRAELSMATVIPDKIAKIIK
jgi:HrpA-like RNA helicase